MAQYQFKQEYHQIFYWVQLDFVDDLIDSLIFDEFLEYVDLINVLLERILHWPIEMLILNNLIGLF